MAREQLKRDNIQRENREFAFTKLFTCGLCGSGVTAEEKFKKQKNGNVHHYIYYGCTRGRDLHCKAGYIREENLIEQLLKIIDEIDLNALGVKEKIKEEIKRYHKFSHAVLGLKEKNRE